MVQWTTTVRLSGRSRVITLPDGLLEQIQWSTGDRLSLTVYDGFVELRSTGKLSLEELMAKVPETGLPSVEELAGLSSPIEPVGREINLPYSESELLKGLDAHGAHADEIFMPSNNESGE